MTSKNSSYNPQSTYRGKMLLESWKRTLWLPSLALLVFFFALPVANGLILQRMDTVVGLNAAAIAANVNSLFLFESPVTKIIFIVGALLSGCTYFHYLHQKRQVDFYHSLPVSRRRLFLNQWAAGALAAIVPYLVMLAIAIAVTLAFGYGAELLWGQVFLAAVFHVVFFLLIYSFVALAAVLTGNLVIQVLVAGVFFSIVPLTFAFVGSAFETFYRTYYAALNPLAEGLLHGSPLTMYIVYGVKPYHLTAWLFIVLAVLVLAVTGLSLFLYGRRPSEAAGHAIAFKGFRPVLKYPVLAVAILGAGLFFYLIGESGGWLLFGLIAGAFVCSRIIEIVYAFDFKAAGRHFLSSGVTLLVVSALVAIPYFDLTGFDRFAPDATEVREARVEISGANPFGLYQPSDMEMSGTWGMSRDGEMKRLESYRVSEDESIAALCDLAAGQAALAGNREEEEGNTLYLTVVFFMEDGSVKSRQFSQVSRTRDGDSLEAILNDGGYREGQVPAENPSPAMSLGYVQFYEVNTAGDLVSGQDADFHRRLFAACRKAVLTMDAAEMRETTPLASLTFASGDLWKSENVTTWDCPLYPSFDEVFAILEEEGYGKESFRLKPESVAHIQTTVYNYEKDFAAPPTETIVTDREKIAAILAETAPMETLYTSVFFGYAYSDKGNEEFIPVLMNGETAPTRQRPER